MIIAHGFEWGKPAVNVSKNYPDTKFIIFTGLVNATNVASIFPMQHEGTYLLGALAAMMSKTGVIGFVGGEKYPNLINILEGYKQGAEILILRQKSYQLTWMSGIVPTREKRRP